MAHTKSTAQRFSSGEKLALSFAGAWNRLEQRLDRALGSILGVSLAEYRLLATLAGMPGQQASRIELAEAVGLSASGVTRALRPLEKRRIVKTGSSKHDARLVLAQLTESGQTLVSDASGVVNDSMGVLLKRLPVVSANQKSLLQMLEEISV